MRNIEEEIRITEGEIEVSVDLWEYQLLAWDIFGPSYKNRSKRRDALQQITVSLGRTWTSFFFSFFKIKSRSDRRHIREVVHDKSAKHY